MCTMIFQQQWKIYGNTLLTTIMPSIHKYLNGPEVTHQATVTVH